MVTKYIEKINWVNENWETIKEYSSEKRKNLSYELTDMLNEILTTQSSINDECYKVSEQLIGLVNKLMHIHN